MADFKFTCAQCGQEIELDELWTGHQIQCPTCQKEITVPPKPDAPPHATFAAAKPGQARLSIGQSHAERSAAERPVAPQAAALEQQLAQAKAGQKTSPMKWIMPVVVVIVLGVGGYLGYPYVKDFLAKRSEAAKQASSTNTQEVATATAPEAAPAPAPEKELPVLPAVWTLDVTKAVIPEGKANGMIASTNFVVETARLDKVGPAYLLQLLEGAITSPDRGFRIYLYPNAGEGITNHTWTISPDQKGKGVPQVIKLAKTNPRYQAQQKTIYSGYALKLQLGDITNGIIRGKIFLAVPPETEQSVVAGVFKATTTVADASGATAVTPVTPPTQPTAPPAPNPAERSAFDKRYGVKR
jgi:DNA-directed RNA polymerase subunit RPC12/RpoP